MALVVSLLTAILPPLLISRFLINLRQAGPSLIGESDGKPDENVQRSTVIFRQPALQSIIGNMGGSLDDGLQDPLGEIAADVGADTGRDMVVRQWHDIHENIHANDLELGTMS
ncbi:hypothetical protein EIP86_009276 [Pleurotus ostreatoroseus]|nr:hypothetical protein EIP86_009276 [Pleurotus ostreatoroseus]